MLFELRRISRNKESDAQFGEIWIDGELQCLSLERLSTLIPLGSFPVSFYFSPHNHLTVPLLIVPDRTYIEMHPANYPAQLEGCIAPCQTHNQDSGSNSHFAFEGLMSKIQNQENLSLVVSALAS